MMSEALPSNGSIFRRRGEVDYHCHILPGIDDGAKTLDESLEMARLLEHAGYREVHCTPHLIKGLYDASTDDVLNALCRLQEALDNAGIAIRLRAGREYFLDEFLLDHIRHPLPLEGANCIMIEIPGHLSEDFVKDTLFEVTCKGFIPLIAHPERCRLFESPDSEDPSGSNRLFPWLWSVRKSPSPSISGSNLLGYLRQLGCRFQANLGSFEGQYGSRVKSNALRLENGALYSYAGTDAHSPAGLRALLSKQ